MIISHNIPAVRAYNAVNDSVNKMNKSIKRLSTGLKINSASDDAAGLAISEKMRAQIAGLNRAAANAQDGISLIQTAEGALGETHSILQRMRELSVQAANDTLTQEDRSYIQEEVDLLREEINHIGNNTQFNKKRLLNGDAAVLWSSSDLGTKAIINGGIRIVDQFGQKKSAQGNYKIDITATPGQNQVQKSGIFMSIYGGVAVNIDYQSDLVSDVQTENLKAGTEYIVTGGDADSSAVIADVIDIKTADGAAAWNSDFIAGTTNSNIELAITLKTLNAGTASTNASAVFDIRALIIERDGTIKDEITDTVTITGNNNSSGSNYDFTNISAAQFNNAELNGLTLDITELMSGDDSGDLTSFKAGDTAIYKVGTNDGATGDVFIDVTRGDDEVSYTDEYIFTASDVAGKDLTLRHYYLDNSGNIQIGSLTLSIPAGTSDSDIIAADGTDDNGDDDTTNSLVALSTSRGGAASGSSSSSSSFSASIASPSTELKDVKQFYNAQGVFILEEPQTLTIVQGDGKKANITLYSGDTIENLAKKINDAIAEDLGQKKYADNNQKFAVFVDENSAAQNTHESVPGTMIIRSIIPGKAGALTFSGSEELINALALNTIQDYTESSYSVSIANAHTGANIISGEKITSNKILGVIHPNIDIEFDAMAGIKAVWSDADKKFNYLPQDYETILHLADNTTVFQIGANQGEDVSLNIADMRAHALGLDAVNVMSRETASQALSIIDGAIHKVSNQRAELGAMQNRLEHTMANLNIAAENLTASESRIRDTDMAKEMMNFVKEQILNQSGMSVLAQANQLPQMILSLMQ